MILVLLCLLSVPIVAQSWNYYAMNGRADSSRTYFQDNSFYTFGVVKKDWEGNYVLKVSWFGTLPNQVLPKSLLAHIGVLSKDWDSLRVSVAVMFQSGNTGQGAVLPEKKVFNAISDTMISWNASWAAMDSVNGINLVFEFFRSPGSLLETGGIVKLESMNLIGVITGIEETVAPNGFRLFQNYPNPFNPSTRITYQIHETGMVTLKIYDVLGNKVTTLVNEEKIAGNYEINFNAGNLSSGLYIYQLKSGNFIQTKKMMLLK